MGHIMKIKLLNSNANLKGIICFESFPFNYYFWTNKLFTFVKEGLCGMYSHGECVKLCIWFAESYNYKDMLLLIIETKLLFSMHN